MTSLPLFAVHVVAQTGILNSLLIQHTDIINLHTEIIRQPVGTLTLHVEILTFVPTFGGRLVSDFMGLICQTAKLNLQFYPKIGQ